MILMILMQVGLARRKGLEICRPHDSYRRSRVTPMAVIKPRVTQHSPLCRMRRNVNMKNDLALDEIKKIRHTISRECGHDPKKLVEYYMKRQRSKQNTSRHADVDTKMTPGNKTGTPAVRAQNG